MSRFVGGGAGRIGRVGKGAGVRTRVHHVLGFFAGLFYFYWTLTSRRGALERGMK